MRPAVKADARGDGRMAGILRGTTRNVVTFVKWTRLSHSTVNSKLSVFGVLLGYLLLHASPVHFTNVTTRRV